MTGTVCLSSLLRHDVRLRRQLSGYEFRDFLGLLCLAAEGRDPAYLPARRVAQLRHELGLSSDAQAARRLARFAGLELVEAQPDGGLLILYLLDQEDDEDETAPPASYASGNGQNGAHANGHNSSNGSGAVPERRQKGRQYSNTPEALRARDAYARNKAARNGQADRNGASEPRETPTDGREVFAQNLTPAESKPHGGASGSDDTDAPKPHAGAGEKREVSRAHVRHSNTVFGDSKNFESSEYGSTVAPPRNLTQTSQPQDGQTSHPPPAARGMPPPRPPLSPQEVPGAKHRDVQAVMAATRDKPDYRNFWLALWKHCHEAGRLDLWDQGFAVFQEAQRVRPPAGPGSIERPPFWLKGTILTLLDRAGCAYAPRGESAPPVQDVSPEEAEDIRRLIAETKEKWAAEQADGPEEGESADA